MMRVKKINNIVVKPITIKNGEKEDKRPIRGADLFPSLSSFIYIASKIRSGKSVCISNILVNCIGRDTTVIFFVSTLYRDKEYKNMMRMCDDNDINYIPYTEITEGAGKDQIDHLKDLCEVLKAKAEAKYLDDKAEAEGEDMTDKLSKSLFKDEEEDEPKKKKDKHQAPEYIMIFDDISGQLKNPNFAMLVKEHRHWNTKIICSSQNYNDINLDVRKQINYMLLFKSMGHRKLLEIFNDISLSVEFEEFVKIYKYATREDYAFLYINCSDSTFRENFNKEILISGNEIK